MDAQITAALIGASATLLTGLGAVWAVIWQIRKQARLGRDQSAHNERLRLKLDLYRSIADECESQQEQVSKISSRLMAFKWKLPTHFDGSTYRLPAGVTGEELLQLAHSVQSGAADLLILLERWEIVDPRLDLFRLALNSVVHDLRTAWDELSPVALGLLPPFSTDEDGTWAPSPENAREMLELIPPVEVALFELTSYLHDFRVEMQNLLLADLFDTRAVARVPLDPKKITVRLDRYDELKKHFRSNTAWGRQFDEVNDEVRRTLEERDR